MLGDGKRREAGSSLSRCFNSGNLHRKYGQASKERMWNLATLRVISHQRWIDPFAESRRWLNFDSVACRSGRMESAVPYDQRVDCLSYSFSGSGAAPRSWRAKAVSEFQSSGP